MKRGSSVGIAVIIIAVVALVLATAIIVISSTIQSRTTLNMGDGVFTAKLAITPAERDKGLGDATSLAPDQAMIFAYLSDSKWPISVIGNKTPVDIIWINQDKKIVYIVTDASADSSTKTVFTPSVDARYVVEVAAGSVGNLNIRVNTTALFDISGVNIR